MGNFIFIDFGVDAGNLELGILSSLESTEVIHGIENIVKRVLVAFQSYSKSMDGCYDKTGPGSVVKTEPVFNALNDLVKRGVKLRYITDIVPENVFYCKEMLKNGHQVRHFDAVKGNFGIADRSEYFSHVVQLEEDSPIQVTVTNIKSFVESQQYFFDSLWKKALSAEQRFKEIEEEQYTQPDFIKTLTNSTQIQKLVFDLVKSAKKEILMVFSTYDTFDKEDQARLHQLLNELATSEDNNVRIRILSPMDELLLQQKSESDLKIDVRTLDKKSWQSNVEILVIDKKLSLEINLKDDIKIDSSREIALATYSNSVSIVWTHTAIFETLWTKTRFLSPC